MVRLIRVVVGLVLTFGGVAFLTNLEWLRGGLTLGLGVFFLVTGYSTSWWRIDWGDAKQPSERQNVSDAV